MYSSGLHTARLLTVSAEPGVSAKGMSAKGVSAKGVSAKGVPARCLPGGCLPRGVSARCVPEDYLPRGVSPQGGVCAGVSAWRVSTWPGGYLLGGLPRGVWQTPQTRGRHPPIGQTDTCENITFANFVCGR